MGSEAFVRLKGVKRSAEGGQGLPEAFAVIGVDIEPAALIARYKGTRNEGYAADVVRAIVQEQRTKGAPPAGFVRTLRGGVQTPIIVCDLNADAKGKSWVVVVGGRQRTLGLRIVNAEREASTPRLPPMQIACVFSPFSRKTASVDAEMAKVVENARVRMTFSARAEVAASLDRRKISHDEIAPLVEAVDDTEVALLIALDGCEQCVKDAVDANRIPLTAATRYSKMDPIKQVQAVGRLLAPNRKAADAAAPPRAKARPAKLSGLLAREIEAVGINGETRALARWYAGDDDALTAHPALLKALESARGQA